MSNSKFETYGITDHPETKGAKCFPLKVSSYSELLTVQHSLLKNIHFISDLLVNCGDGMITESKEHLGEILKGVSFVALEISENFIWNGEVLDDLNKKK